MQKALEIIEEVKKAVVGKNAVVGKMLMVILAQGHILLEDIPGVGKTTLALAFSKAMALDYRRMQFTPDVMPTDVTGFSVYNKATGQLEYKPGAALCNLFLADEINRTSSKTQAALLEVMEEGRITVDGVTRETPKPYTVIATQNPVGSAGTQLLPESQMDRFMVCLRMENPKLEDEVEILRRKQGGDPLEQVQKVVDAQGILAMQHEVENVYLADSLYGYIARLSSRHPEGPDDPPGSKPPRFHRLDPHGAGSRLPERARLRNPARRPDRFPRRDRPPDCPEPPGKNGGCHGCRASGKNPQPRRCALG